MILRYGQKNEGAQMSTLYNFAFYLPFGLAFVVPADFLPELGAAFLALAFVAILVKCI